MFSRSSIPLFSLSGFQVKLDPSWFFLAALIVWMLSTGLFPTAYPGLKASTYLWMGVWVVLGLFGSIVVHEFAHSWVARRFGLPMQGITLFIFGGVAEMEEDSPNPKTEFLMALAGPLTSVLVLLLCAGLAVWGTLLGWKLPVIGVLSYLATMNGILVLFNMVPAFPLDGGRVLRSALWAWKKNLKWATRVTSRLGGWFGGLLIFLGLLSVFQGELIGGIWWIIMGLFLRRAAEMSYQQILLRKQLEGEPVQRFMQNNVVTVSPELPVKDLVEHYFYRYYFKGYPVVQNEQLLGHVSLEQIQGIPVSGWASRTVADVMKPVGPDNTIALDSDAMAAFSRMSKTGGSQLMVVSGSKLAGLLNLKNLLRFVALQIALEES